MLSLLPNALSIIRGILSPFIFWAVRNHDYHIVAFLAAIAIISDFLDGFLARRLNAVSQAGKILDPLADKLCVAAAALAATIYMEMPIYLLAAVILRDIMIALFGLSIINKKQHIPVSNIWGKITVFVLTLTLIVYIFEIRVLYLPASLLALAFILISSYSYFRIGFGMLKDGRHN
jgi:CDP-diacylglycerol--glycerol-3-phosphate 3-phosphatidyltransferase